MPTSNNKKLLIVEDDLGLQKQLRWCFDGYEVITATNRSEAIAELRRHEPPVVLQDLGLPPDPDGVEEGIATLKEILSLSPHTKVIVVTGNQERDSAVRAIGLGAYDFYQKPVDNDILNLLVQRAFHISELEEQNRRLLRQQGDSPLSGVIASSDAMVRVCRLVEKIAPTSVTTMLLGESGTGKELLARALHRLSPRSQQAFVAINCAAIPDALLESELFGYEKGAFTGAVKQTPGKVELANSGTLFLDEVGDLSLPLQAKLLRFLQERVIERIGGREEIPVDVRVICATNQDLKRLIEKEAFREDLYYRISEVTIQIPPLRERQGDQVVLARALLERMAHQHGLPRRTLTDGAIRAIEAYAWPGNIRELENKLKSALILAEGNQITAKELDLEDAADSDFLSLRQVRTEAERVAIKRALAVSDGNLSKAAQLLGVTRPTLYDLLGKHGVSVQK